MGSTLAENACNTTVRSCGFVLFAPWSIHSFSVSICSGVRFTAPDLLFAGGISMSLACSEACTTRLSALLPGINEGPDSPPLIINSGVSMFRSALVVVLLWQEMQLPFRKG